MPRKANNPQNLKPFKPGHDPRRNVGRPKKLVSHLNDELKAEGFEPVSVGQVQDCYLTLINLPQAKLEDIAANQTDYPFLYRIVARELLGNKGNDMLERLLDRGHGKAKNTTDITTGGQPIRGFQSIEEAFFSDIKDDVKP